MKYSIAVSDYDGTLANSSDEISDFTLDVIKKFVSNGGIFAVSTGRMFASIYKRLLKYNLLFDNTPVIAYHGGMIVDSSSKKIIYHLGVKCQDAADVVTELLKDDLTVQIYVNDKIFVSNLNQYALCYAKKFDVGTNKVDSDMVEFITHNNLIPTKILAIADKERIDELYNKYVTLFSDRINVTRSNYMFLEFLNIDVSKGRALKFLADYYNKTVKDIIAFGDALNDIPMLKECGMGVAVGNAMEEVKKIADITVEMNDDNGVAKSILKYCMGE